MVRFDKKEIEEACEIALSADDNRKKSISVCGNMDIQIPRNIEELNSLRRDLEYHRNIVNGMETAIGIGQLIVMMDAKVVDE